MKRILLISYYFPPQTSVGTFRLKRFVDHMKQCGLDVTILTVKNPDKQFHPYSGEMPQEDKYLGAPVHRVAEWPVRWVWQWPTRAAKFLSKLLPMPFQEHSFASRFWHIDMEWGWIQPAYRKARELLKAEPLDAIVISCPPFSSAHIGAKLKKHHNIPLILDFRDGWVASSPYLHQVAKKDGPIEQKLLTQTDHLIVTSKSDQECYQALLGKDKVSLIYNGYDTPFILSQNETPETAPKDDTLKLLYLGAWGVFGRSPERLLRALKAANIPWHLTSIGSTNEIVEKSAQKLGVMGSIKLISNQPKEALIPWIAESDALFVIKGAPPQGGRDTHIAAKIYDYLATGKAVLGQLPEGDSKDMLEEYCHQPFIAPPEDHEQLIQQIQAMHKAKIENRLVLKPNDKFLKEFSGEELTRKFVETILKTNTI